MNEIYRHHFHLSIKGKNTTAKQRCFHHRTRTREAFIIRFEMIESATQR